MINEEHIIFITKLDTIIKAGLEATNKISKENESKLKEKFSSDSKEVAPKKVLVTEKNQDKNIKYFI